jgi:excisionase family DNA binding protein
MARYGKPQQIEPISVRIPEAIRMIGVGRTTIYQLIASGDLEAAKVGRSTVVFVDSVRQYLSANRKPRRDKIIRPV